MAVVAGLVLALALASPAEGAGMRRLAQPACKKEKKDKEAKKAERNAKKEERKAEKEKEKGTEGKEKKPVGKKIADAFKAVGKTLAAPITGPIKLVINIVKNFGGFIKLVGKHGFKGAVQELWKKFTAKVKAEYEFAKQKFKTVFEGFRKVLLLDDPKKIPKETELFARSVVKESQALMARFNTLIGMPKLIAELVGWMGAGPLYPAVLAAVLPTAFINFGFRKLMGFIIPKLILGVGQAFDAAQHSKAGAVFGKIVQGLLKIVGVGGGLIQMFLKEPLKTRLRNVFARIADVAGRVQKAIEGAAKVAEQIRAGSFEGVEAALASTATLPSELTKEDLQKMVGGLMDFGKEQLWLALNPPLRKLLTKALSGMDTLLSTLKNALTGSVGEVPFVGGVLAAGLGFGLDAIFKMVKNFFIDGVMKMAETILSDTLNDIKASVTATLFKSDKSTKGAAKFVQLAQLVGKLAGDVSASMQTASKGVKTAIATLVTTALEKFVLGRVRNPEVRALLTEALNAVSAEISKEGKFKLVPAVIGVLKRIAAPLGALVAKPIQNANLKGIVQKGIETLVNGFADEAGVKRLMAKPLGFLTEIGMELLGKIKDELANLVLGKIKNEKLKAAVAAAVGALAETVKEGGFSALLQFDKLLGKLYAAVKQPLLEMLVDKIKSPELKEILEGGLTFVASELESKGVKGILAGGIGHFFVELFVRVKSPLVALLLKNVSSPILRDAVDKALDALVEKARAGKLAELLDFKKVLAGILRFLNPHVVGFLTGKIKDEGLRTAMAGAIGPAVERLATAIEGGSFSNLTDVLVAVAEPAVQALKAFVVAKLPGILKDPIAQAFDKVLPMLRTAEGRAELLRDGPRMLWSAVVSYVRGLYEKAKDLVATKWAEIKEIAFKVMEMLRSGAGDFGAALKELGNLGTLLAGAKLPTPG